MKFNINHLQKIMKGKFKVIKPPNYVETSQISHLKELFKNANMSNKSLMLTG